MRLLITTGLYYPHVGGAEEVSRRLAEEMVRRGHDVTVATGFEPTRESESHNFVQIRSFDVSGSWALGMRGNVHDYQDFLLQGGFDVTFHYAAQVWTTDLVLPLLGRLESPAILAPCGYSGLRQPRFGRYFARLKEVLPGFAALVHHSDVYQDAHYARDAMLRRCVTIPNAVDTLEFSVPPGTDPAADFRKVLGIGSRPVVLSVANFTGGKGHDLAIAAFQAVASSEAVLVLIGNESPSGCIEQCRAAAQADPRILILEGLPRERVVQAYHAADVFVLGSQVECSPLVILEAMATGTPWISTPVGNVNELSGGIVCTAHEFTDRLRMLLQDARRRQALGARGLELACERLTQVQVHDAYEELFFRVKDGHDLVGAPVPAERFAVDDHQIDGLTSYESGDMSVAAMELAQGVERDPTAIGLRMRLLDALLRSGEHVPLQEMFELMQDELELTPWLTEPNLVLFFVGGAVDADLDEATERATELGLPADELLELSHRGREIAAQSEQAVKLALQALISTSV